VVVQSGRKVETLIGFGKEHHAVGDELIDCKLGEVLRVIYSLSIRVGE